MKLSTLQTTLAQLGVQPSKSLGQNFLHDQNLAEWIVAQLNLRPGEAWLELGPGLGALTEFAQRRSPHGLSIEKDGRLAEFLRERFPALEIRHGDAGKFDVRELFARGPVKLFGNLPYNISSQILFAFTADPSPVSTMVFTLQRELAERLSATPRTKDYGALTLLIGRQWRVKYLRTLPGSVFLPAPKVESGVIALIPRELDEFPTCDGPRFTALVKQGFSQRRKQLRKMLAGYAFEWPALCAHLGVPETARAEELSLAQWIALTNWAGGFGGMNTALKSQAQDVHGEIFDVVDAEDNVIGKETRHEVHARNLLHRAVHIFVFNQRDELFLQLRSRHKDVHPRRWDSSAAGHVDSGQTYDATAPRELQEELGVHTSLECVAAISACANTGWEHVRLYRARHEGPFTLHPAEIETGGFFTLPQIAHWIAVRPADFASGFLECWQRYRALSPAAASASFP